MADLRTPGSADELVEIIAEARAGRRRIEVIGGGTKRGIGAVAAPDLLLAMDGMDRVVDYAPEELVLTVQAGAPLAAIETLVAGHGQMLAFEPPHLGRLLGAKGKATIGGTVAANLSGPRRIKAGAARDHVLG
ncbi:MAG: FAD-binding protein, partial [Phenylobacterium sp.]